MSPKERIIQEAAAMFLDEGIKSVRMDDIATRLGVSKRTLYEMFGDKRDLLEQSLTWHFSCKRCDIHDKTTSAANVIEEIFMILGAMKRDEKDAALIAGLKKFYPDIFGRLEEEAHRFSHDKFSRLLDRGMKEGLFLPDMNEELALMTLVYTMGALFEQRYHFQMQQKNLPHPLSPRAAFEYVLVNFFRGLATHKGIEMIDELVIKYRNRI